MARLNDYWETAYVHKDEKGERQSLLVKASPGKGQTCDGCGKTTTTGFWLFHLMDGRLYNTGAFSCSLDCARNNDASV